MINVFVVFWLFKHLFGKNQFTRKYSQDILWVSLKKSLLKEFFFAGINIQEIMTNFAKLA